jgi:hypothetical protein
MSLKQSALQEEVYRVEARLQDAHDRFALAMEADACDAELEYHSQNIETAEFEVDAAYHDLFIMPYHQKGGTFGECHHMILSDD